jgi:hypothetical protein
MFRVATLGCLVLVGCAAESRDASPFGDGGGTDGGAVSDDGSGGVGSASEGVGEATAADGSPDEAGDGLKLDVGPSEDEGPGEGGSQAGCTSVDVLFVIDNSPSMSPYQEALAVAFPDFVDAMIENLPPGTDLHVGVTTTDFNCGSSGCSCSESTVNCASAQTEQEILDHYDTPDQGDNGGNGSQGRLYRYQGLHWYETTTDADPAGLEAWFTGAATEAGELGCSYEMLSAGAAYVVHEANEPTNGGFIRDEGAVLLVFVLSDEPDKSPETVAAYHDLLASAKAGCGGDPCILTAGLLNGCVQQTDQKVWQFLNAFGEAPVFGSIDATGEYAQVVGEALAQVVGETCETIPPVG